MGNIKLSLDSYNITMFEARITQGALLKKIIEAMKDMVTEANFDCSTTGISLQAMVRDLCY